MPYFLSKHPLIGHKLSILRNKETASWQVRALLREIGLLLGYEATQDLDVAPTGRELQSPIATYEEHKAQCNVGLVPILRSGLSLVDGLLELIPTARTLHLGIYRDLHTFEPVEYYNKFPGSVTVDMAIVLDPIIATGGTALATVNILKEWGVKRIKFIGVVASEAGLNAVLSDHPEVQMYVASIDRALDGHGYVVPGVGDAGDRIFKTISE